MDDLEEIWGPRGRATVDPASVRPVPSAADLPVPPAPAPATIPVAIASIVPAPAPLGARGPGSASHGGRSHLAWVAAGAAAAVVSVVFVAMATRSSPPPPRLAAPATATTIVSAAADLLGRGRVTTTTASEATAGGAAPPAGTPAATPSTSPPPPPTSSVPVGPRPVAGSSVSAAGAVPPLALAEETAHRFVDVIARRDCDGLWNLLSRGTQDFLVGSAEPGERSGRDELCDGLRNEDAMPTMRVHGPAEARGDRAVVPLESEGEVEPLTFVAEDGRWVIDLFGDFAEAS